MSLISTLVLGGDRGVRTCSTGRARFGGDNGLHGGRTLGGSPAGGSGYRTGDIARRGGGGPAGGEDCLWRFTGGVLEIL